MMDLPEKQSYWKIVQDDNVQEALAAIARDMHTLIDCVKLLHTMVLDQAECLCGDTDRFNEQGKRIAMLENAPLNCGRLHGEFRDRLKALEDRWVTHGIREQKGKGLRDAVFDMVVDRLNALEDNVGGLDASEAFAQCCERLTALEHKDDEQIKVNDAHRDRIAKMEHGTAPDRLDKLAVQVEDLRRTVNKIPTSGTLDIRLGILEKKIADGTVCVMKSEDWKPKQYGAIVCRGCRAWYIGGYSEDLLCPKCEPKEEKLPTCGECAYWKTCPVGENCTNLLGQMAAVSTTPACHNFKPKEGKARAAHNLVHAKSGECPHCEAFYYARCGAEIRFCVGCGGPV